MNRPQLRAALILQVRSGQLTAQQAARQLGISRQRYYHWEKRALKALLSALQDRRTGRPRNKPDPRTQAFLLRIKQLEQQVQTLQLKDQLRQRLKDLRSQPDRKKNSR
jgi:transposase